MLRHHDVANHLEFIFLTDFFKDIQEQVSPRSGAEEGLPLVTATGDEMEIPTSIEPAQSFGHGRNFILPFECEGREFVNPPFAAASSRAWGRTYGPQRMGHPRYGEGQKSIGRVGHPGRYTSMVNVPIRGCTRVAMWAQACGSHHSKKERRRLFTSPLGISFWWLFTS